MNPEETVPEEATPEVEEATEETPADLGINVGEEVTSQEAIG